MNGIGRASVLYPRLVCIMPSGYSDLSSVTKAVNHGAIFRFLSKPWQGGAVRNTVREALRAAELRSTGP